MTVRMKILISQVASVVVLGVLIFGLVIVSIQRAGKADLENLTRLHIQETEELAAALSLELIQITDQSEQETEKMRSRELQRIKAQLIDYVNNVHHTITAAYDEVHSIEYLKEVYGSRLRNVVDISCSIIEHYMDAVERGEISRDQAQEAAKSSLRLMRYDKGTGYIWINDTGEPYPRMVMHPTAPALNGKIMDNPKYNCAQGRNANLFSTMVEVCRNDGAGFVEYEWPKPSADGLTAQQPKLSYVRQLAGWGWIVGTGIYVDDALRDRLNKLKTEIATMRYGEAGYFWINDMGRPIPRMVMHPTAPALNGKILDNPKYNCALGEGRNLFVAMADICKTAGGGFVDYKWPKPLRTGLTEEQPKLSYVKSFEPLGWVIGTGLYINDINKIGVDLDQRLATATLVAENRRNQIEQTHIENLARKQAGTDGQIRSLLIWCLPLVAGIIVLAMVFGWFISGNISRSINTVAVDLNRASEQVMSASTQMSEAGRQLASGSSQQANSLEQISSALEEVNSMTHRNAEYSNHAINLMKEVKLRSDKGREFSGRLTQGIESIKTATTETARIIKSIDEIAFQTNLLALNAAVEAARAGEAGKGFAVVAEEVRNLAQRSAEAARDTASLIAESQQHAEAGAVIAEETVQAVKEITDSTVEVGELISNITAASKDQNLGIEQITSEMAQIDSITQSSSVNAKETATSSKELSCQAQELNTLVGNLEAIVGGPGNKPA